jgi:hypothetical protein
MIDIYQKIIIVEGEVTSNITMKDGNRFRLFFPIMNGSVFFCPDFEGTRPLGTKVRLIIEERIEEIDLEEI